MDCKGPATNGDCGRAVKYNGLCSGHAEQKRLGRTLTPLEKRRPVGSPLPPCGFRRCSKPANSAGLCWGHYDQQRRGKELGPLKQRRATGSSAERDEQGRKYCDPCATWKPEAQFHRVSAALDGLHWECRPCSKARRTNRVFNLSPERYAEMLHQQGGGCAVCGRPPTEGIALNVDHDHNCCPGQKQSCGQCVRGLLCWACNTALGQLDDDEARIRRAADYIAAWHDKRPMAVIG